MFTICKQKHKTNTNDIGASFIAQRTHTKGNRVFHSSMYYSSVHDLCSVVRWWRCLSSIVRMMDTYLLSLSLSLSELESLELLPPPDAAAVMAAATVASTPATSKTYTSLFKYFEIIHGHHNIHIKCSTKGLTTRSKHKLVAIYDIFI